MRVKLLGFLFLMAVIFYCPVLLQAQQTDMDSLNKVIKKYTSTVNFEKDTNYINTINELAFKFSNINPDTTILLGQQLTALCENINFQKGKAEALKNMGLAYNVKGNYNQALSLYAEALALCEKIGYLKGQARIDHNIGIAFSNLGNYSQALEHYFKALKLREKLDDKIGISSSVNGIGSIYFVQGKYEDAKEKYLRALKISEEINYKGGIEAGYANIGEVYFRQAKYAEAEENLLKSLTLTKQTGNKETMSFISTLLASVYFKQGKNTEAIASYLQAKKKAAEIGSQEYECRSSLGLGEVYLQLNENNKALLYVQEAYKTAKEIRYKELIRDCNEMLSRIYEKDGQGLPALFHQKQFKLYADSINNLEVEKKAVNAAAEYEYSKKEILLKAEQVKKDAEFQKQGNQQRWILFSIFAALVSSFVVIGLIFRSRQKEKSANRLLQHQNEEIEKQKAKVEFTLNDLKATQTQLIQSEKMASLGELTAGIAHEIQNPLNFVNNFSELNVELVGEMNQELKNGNIENALALAADIESNEQKINHHGKRADAIVKGMLQHSRSSTGIKEPTDINALADEYLRLSYHGLRAKDKTFNATINTGFDESVGNIKIIPQDIGRVILNLLTNAFYVVDEKKKSGIADYEPTVSVSTSQITFPSGGRGVEIRVSDNGNGIPQKVLDKIFQPFFTTKPTGQGTGLGLSLSYDIITKGHGGELKVETKEGNGTTFIIILPNKP